VTEPGSETPPPAEPSAAQSAPPPAKRQPPAGPPADFMEAHGNLRLMATLAGGIVINIDPSDPEEE
jgi:hypothetical protein